MPSSVLLLLLEEARPESDPEGFVEGKKTLHWSTRRATV